jgi:flagellar hook-length control protein FliK
LAGLRLHTPPECNVHATLFRHTSGSCPSGTAANIGLSRFLLEFCLLAAMRGFTRTVVQMESQLSFLATGAPPIASPLATNSVPTGPASRTGIEGSAFAEVLTGETLRTQRQQLAALGAQDTALQVVPLGSHMRVITSDAPLPDMESLAQFARQQGLNEAAVQALFGPTAERPLSTVNLTLTPATGTGLNDANPTRGPEVRITAGLISAPAANVEITSLNTSIDALAVQGARPSVNPAAANLPLNLTQFASPQGVKEPTVNETPIPAPFGRATGIPLSAVSLAATPAAEPGFQSESPSKGLRVSAAAVADPTLATAANLEIAVPQMPTDTLAPPSAAPAAGIPSAMLATGTDLQDTLLGADLKTIAAPSAALKPPAEIEVAILRTTSTVLAPQGAAPVANASKVEIAGLAARSDVLVPPSATPVANLPVASVVFASGDTLGLTPLTARSWVGDAANTSASTAVNADAPTADMRPQDALRLTLAMPAPEITKRLAQMSGTGKASTWAALLSAGPLAKESAAPASDTLQLEVPPDYDLTLDITPAADASAQNNDLAAQSGTSAPQVVAQATAGGRADSNASNAQAQADHRAQQFQQMADQMGQAAAQRLIAQIERGQWKLQMRMQPAALGTVKVELDMHAGGLDASFSADNAITRELMVQGSNRLKETLADAGMTVASVTVNRDQSRQSGGNSTPGKGRGPSTSVGATGRIPAAEKSVPKVANTTPPDGLNVLA